MSVQWGQVDPAASTIALGIAIPLACVVSICIMGIGAYFAPDKSSQRRNFAVLSKATPLFHVKKVTKPEVSRPEASLGADQIQVN